MTADDSAGRTVRYGPRVIDIDILFYDDVQLGDGRTSRSAPTAGRARLCPEYGLDIAPTLIHPALDAPVEVLWRRLGSSTLTSVMPFGNRLWDWGKKSCVMGILNTTPDSFSGDGLANPHAS